MRIYKDKLIQALKILDLTPNQAIRIVNAGESFLCRTYEWESTDKGFVIFPNDEPKGLEIPRCITLSEKDIKKIYHTVKHKTTAISVSLVLYHFINKRKQLIKVLQGML